MSADRATSALKIDELVVTSTGISGLMVLSVKKVTEPRGEVRELYRRSRYSDQVPGVSASWDQINLTATKQGAVRGLHGEQMQKLVTVASGRAFGVYVDARIGSPTRGAVETVDLVPGIQVLVPSGVCNGFQATGSGITEYLYFFDHEWKSGMPGVAIDPLDRELAIAWPILIDSADESQISAKDASAPSLSEVLAAEA
jgi:dTDP-4-dehydrorhamnose 3,5-epimerase